MVFSSITFLGFFLPVLLLLYFILPNRNYRNVVLLFSSLLFYAWGEPKFVLLMIASILFNYYMGLLIANSREQNRKAILIFSVAVNLLVLFIFKYLGFSCEIINYIIKSLNLKPLEVINLVLPIGISFYTFQEISYIVDVYRQPELVQRKVLNLGLYITFFPQLIAGPIVRYHDINTQIEDRTETIEKASIGFQRFIIGLAKKVCIANNMAYICDSIYNAGFFSYSTWQAWLAAIAYALQIYYDFSGYSDMAIGLAKVFGFDLLENFNYPYAAKSVTDFWKRWHISLTSFFRDYVYIPLGGNRKGKVRTIINRMSVFFLTGLWHGAAFNFIFWGLLHGIAMVIERFFSLENRKNKIFAFFYRIFTLFVIVMLWVLFRNGLVETIKIWIKMFGINYTIFTSPRQISTLPFFLFADTKAFVMLGVGIICSFPWWRGIKLPTNRVFLNVFSVIKCIVLIGLLILCFSFLANDTYNPFIYFRF